VLRQRREAEGRLEAVTEDDVRRGSICEPSSGACSQHTRLVGVTLVDVAGLVPGAHAGRGRGNQFLSDLARCDALIQVVDSAGTTDLEGNPLGSGGSDPLEEYEFLVDELSRWVDGILESGWRRGTRRAQSEGERGLVAFICEQLSGIGADEPAIQTALDTFTEKNMAPGPAWEWPAELRLELSSDIRRAVFPLCVAANKADLEGQVEIDELRQQVEADGGLLVSTSADSELALRRAAKAGLIEYKPGATSFSITAAGAAGLTSAQQKGLEQLGQCIERMGGTGLQELVEQIVYQRLEQIIVYPVQDETHWTDGDGRVLPDALLVPRGVTAKGLAFSVHTDLGAGFIRATDGRSGRIIGAEHELEDNDVIKIHAKT
jgi:ribosome-binding ATPase YchF (GTP1/OBG family)